MVKTPIFKDYSVGDRVRLTGTGGITHNWPIGQTGTIRMIDTQTSYPYQLEHTNPGFATRAYRAEEIELVSKLETTSAEEVGAVGAVGEVEEGGAAGLFDYDPMKTAAYEADRRLVEEYLAVREHGKRMSAIDEATKRLLDAWPLTL